MITQPKLAKKKMTSHLALCYHIQVIRRFAFADSSADSSLGLGLGLGPGLGLGKVRVRIREG